MLFSATFADDVSLPGGCFMFMCFSIFFCCRRYAHLAAAAAGCQQVKFMW